MRLLRVPEILASRGGGHSKLYDDIKHELWPPLIKLGRCSALPEHEVRTMVQAIVAGASPDQLRQLVRGLVAQRKMPTVTASASAA